MFSIKIQLVANFFQHPSGPGALKCFSLNSYGQLRHCKWELKGHGVQLLLESEFHRGDFPV